jgi:hypothetical protein
MGIYSDKCDQCGHHVKKRAKFCSKCGNPAPGGWIKCHKCRKWIGTDSEFCPHCKAPQHVSDRESIVEGVIKRSKGVFLQRYDLNKISSRLGKEQKLIIEHGNAALLMVDGKIAETLQPGSYSLNEGIFASLKNKPNMSVFLIDSGEIIFPYSQMKIKTREDLEVNLYTEIIFKLNIETAHYLISNLLKSDSAIFHVKDFNAADEGLNQDIQDGITRNPLNTNLSNKTLQLGYTDFWDYFKTDLHNSVIKLCANVSIDALIKDPDIRFTFEDTLGRQVSEKAQSYSMNLVRVAAVNFYGPEYEKLRKAAGELEIKTREAVLEKRARKLLIESKKDKVTDEQDLQIYLDQLAYEYDIDSETKQNELEQLREELAHKLNLKSVVHEQEISSRKSEFNRGEDSKDVDHDIVQDQKRFANEREKRKSNHLDEIGETTDWVKIRALKDAQKLTSEAEKMKVYSNYSVTELAAILPTDQVDKIIKIRQAEAASKLEEKMADLSPEQILAMKAGDSPEAAKALAEIAKAKVDAGNKEAEIKAKMAEKANEQMERVLNKSLDANAKAAGDVKIIK